MSRVPNGRFLGVRLEWWTLRWLRGFLKHLGSLRCCRICVYVAKFATEGVILGPLARHSFCRVALARRTTL